MTIKSDKCNPSRRNFLKTALAAGAGSLAAPAAALSAARSDKPLRLAAADTVVPARPFGRSGIRVAILSLGGMFDIPSNQLMLKQSIRWGVTYWDTANSYGGGRSERGIGKYFAKNPADRNKIFLVTKSGAWTLNGMDQDLDESLERMNTGYVDLFFVHGISSTRSLDKDMRAWAEKQKSLGKIKLFGFSTHSNMDDCLLEAAKMDWIDGIMFTYNYRLMERKRMRAAVDACHAAGIGLTAMKAQGGGPVRTDSETELQMAGRFLQKGFTDGQAKLKAVWEDDRIASICSQMPNLSLLSTNVAAAIDKSRLSDNDRRLLHRYARETRSDYCAGCTANCETALSEKIPVGDVLRFMMYSRSYGDLARARHEYGQLPQKVRRRLAHVDYGAAEKSCPHGIAIGRLMRAAVRDLG
jgi:predicted aldo/keto reductase-like oxidoreductase